MFTYHCNCQYQSLSYVGQNISLQFSYFKMEVVKSYYSWKVWKIYKFNEIVIELGHQYCLLYLM